MTEVFEEESWESEISAALASLGEVEPPPGFLSSAIDHRPMFAGRVTVGLLAVAGLALGAAASGGLLAPRQVVPELQALAAKHESAVHSGLSGPAASPDVELPEDFEFRGTVTGDSDVEQSLYDADGIPVSVFTQPGDVDFSNLPPDGRRAIDGNNAWVSDEVVVIETTSGAVTIIGLPEGSLGDVLDALSNGDGVVNRLTEAMGGLTAQLGFEDPR